MNFPKIKREHETKNRTIDKDGHLSVREIIRGRNILQRDKKKFLNFGIIGNWNLRKNPATTFIITMFYSNGTAKTFTIRTTKSTFSHHKKEYYIYYEESFFDLSLDNYHLYYNEESAVPINREIVKTGQENWFSVTPHNLKSLVKMEYIKALVGSGKLENKLNLLLILVAICTISSILVLLKVFNVIKAS